MLCHLFCSFMCFSCIYINTKNSDVCYSKNVVLATNAFHVTDLFVCLTNVDFTRSLGDHVSKILDFEQSFHDNLAKMKPFTRIVNSCSCVQNKIT